MKDSTRQHFITAKDSGISPPSQLEAGIQQAIKLLKQDAGHERLLITCYSKEIFERVKSRIASGLEIKNPTHLWDTRGGEGPVLLATERDQLPYSWNGPALLIYPNSKILNRVGDIHGVTAEIVVPWADVSDGISDWISAWSPEPIGNATTNKNLPSDLSNAAKKALRSLSVFINPANGLITRSDREYAINTFVTLLEYEPDTDPTVVRSYLVSKQNLPGAVADEALKILQDITAGKKLRGQKDPDSNRYQRWCSTD